VKKHEPAAHAYDLERLIFFSDGVFAIVITLLVIELRPPAGWDFTYLTLWRAEWRALVGYAFSFLAVGTYWNLHRRVFRRIVHFHPSLVFFNLLLLGFVVLIPFGSALVVEGPREEPFVILLVLFIAVGIALTLLWGFAALLRNLVEPRLARRDRLALLGNLLAPPAQLGVLLVWTLCGSSGAWLVPIFLPVVLLQWVLKKRTGLQD